MARSPNRRIRRELFEDACIVTSEALEPVLQLMTYRVELETKRRTIDFVYIQPDGNNAPSVDLLVDHMIAHALHYVFPEYTTPGTPTFTINVEQQNAKESFKAFLDARTKARREEGLTSEAGETGEYGELLLFCILEAFYKIPQLVAKVSLKTDTNMPVHGSDGMHACIDSEGTVELWLGESKIYADVGGAIRDAFASVTKMSDAQELKRELLLYKGKATTQSTELRATVTNAIQKNSYRLVTPMLIGFNSDVYSSIVNGDPENRIDVLEAAIINASKDWETKVRKQSSKVPEEKRFVVILLPFADKETFCDLVKAKLNG